MMRHIPSSALAAVPVPITWLLGGESRDWYTRLRGRVQRAAPQIRVERIPGVGHLAHVESPEAFAAAVLEALPG